MAPKCRFEFQVLPHPDLERSGNKSTKSIIFSIFECLNKLSWALLNTTYSVHSARTGITHYTTWNI